MSIIMANKNENTILQVKSSGPYVSSNSLKFINKTSINILWKKYKGLIKDKYKSPFLWDVEYEEIQLGEFTILPETIIDIFGKYNSDSKINRYLLFDNSNEEIHTKINPDKNGTSSDVYVITFNTDTKYIKYYDSWVDH